MTVFSRPAIPFSRFLPFASQSDGSALHVRTAFQPLYLDINLDTYPTLFAAIDEFDLAFTDALSDFIGMQPTLATTSITESVNETTEDLDIRKI